MSDHPPLAVHVWGEYACFTRPEMKVERVSYPVMTPSAARGVLESIFWKPEIRWRVLSIAVLKPIRHLGILRNEASRKIPVRSASAWMKQGFHETYLVDDDRQQRNTLCLRDVAYRIEAQIALRDHATNNLAAYRDQFRRRVERGQCYIRPALGCREFAAHFGPPDPDARPMSQTDDLGQMLFDVTYDDQTGRGTPIFFHARLDKGLLHVPQRLYEEVGA
jgi:CRISPR-associated protein Cas5d